MFEDIIQKRNQSNREAFANAESTLASMVGRSTGKPGVVSLSSFLSVLSMYGINPGDVELKLGTDKEFENTMKHVGLLYRKVHLQDGWWKESTGAFMVKNEKGERIALFPGIFGYGYVDPGNGRYRRINKKNGKQFCGEAFGFSRAFPAKKLSVSFLYRYALRRIQTRDVVILLSLCLVVLLLESFIPFANRIVFRDVIPSGAISNVLPICALLFGAGVSAVLFDMTRSLMLLRIKDKLNIDIQGALVDRMLSLPATFFKERSAGEICSRVLSANNIYQIITVQILSAIVVALFSIVYIFITGFFAPELIWVSATITLLYALFTIYLFKKYRAAYDKVMPNKSRTQGFIYNAISGIHKIKNNAAEARVFKEWAKRFSQSELITGTTPVIIKYRRAFVMLLSTSATVLAWASAYRCGLPVSDYIAFMSAFGIMSGGFDKMLNLFQDFATASAQIKLVEPILETIPENSDSSEFVTDISGQIEIDNLSFRYSDNSPWILNNVSIRIPSGQNVGIVGFSGCGKSTLLKLMTGLETATSGTIFYDHSDIAKVNLTSLRQFIGYCPQRILIFPETIMNNIRISAPESTEEDVWRAARIACLDEDISRMPAGMNTMLGEGGKGLSGGQCQRILIARAVLTNPRIMFFDEATSALDNITQKKVSENLRALNCTRVTVAHRLSTLEHCDRIIVLDKGVLVEDGTPEELMAARGFFYKLSERQRI